MTTQDPQGQGKPRWLQLQEAMGVVGVPRTSVTRRVGEHLDTYGGSYSKGEPGADESTLSIGTPLGKYSRSAGGATEYALGVGGAAGEGLANVSLGFLRAVNWLGYEAPKLLAGRSPNWERISPDGDLGIPKTAQDLVKRVGGERLALRYQSRLASINPQVRVGANIFGELPAYFGGKGWTKLFSGPGKAISVLGKPGQMGGKWLMKNVPEANAWLKFAKDVVPAALGNSMGFGLYNFVTTEGTLEERNHELIMGSLAGGAIGIAGEVARVAEVGLLKASATKAQLKNWRKVLDDLEAGKVDFPFIKRVMPKAVANAIDNVGFSALGQYEVDGEMKWWVEDLFAGLAGDEEAMKRAATQFVTSYPGLVMARGGHPTTVRRDNPRLAKEAAWHSWRRGEERMRRERKRRFAAEREANKGQSREQGRQKPTGFDRGVEPQGIKGFDQGKPVPKEAEPPKDPGADAEAIRQGEQAGEGYPEAFGVMFDAGWSAKARGEGEDLVMHRGGELTDAVTIENGGNGDVVIHWELYTAVTGVKRGDREEYEVRLTGAAAQEFLANLARMSRLRIAEAHARFAGKLTPVEAGTGIYRDEDGAMHAIDVKGDHKVLAPGKKYWGQASEEQRNLYPAQEAAQVDPEHAANAELDAWSGLVDSFSENFEVENYPGFDQIAVAVELLKSGQETETTENLRRLLLDNWAGGEVSNAERLGPMLNIANVDLVGDVIGKVMSGNLNAEEGLVALSEAINTQPEKTLLEMDEEADPYGTDAYTTTEAEAARENAPQWLKDNPEVLEKYIEGRYSDSTILDHFFPEEGPEADKAAEEFWAMTAAVNKATVRMRQTIGADFFERTSRIEDRDEAHAAARKEADEWLETQRPEWIVDEKWESFKESGPGADNIDAPYKEGFENPDGPEQFRREQQLELLHRERYDQEYRAYVAKGGKPMTPEEHRRLTEKRDREAMERQKAEKKKRRQEGAKKAAETRRRKKAEKEAAEKGQAKPEPRKRKKKTPEEIAGARDWRQVDPKERREAAKKYVRAVEAQGKDTPKAKQLQELFDIPRETARDIAKEVSEKEMKEEEARREKMKVELANARQQLEFYAKREYDLRLQDPGDPKREAARKKVQQFRKKVDKLEKQLGVDPKSAAIRRRQAKERDLGKRDSGQDTAAATVARTGGIRAKTANRRRVGIEGWETSAAVLDDLMKVKINGQNLIRAKGRPWERVMETLRDEGYFEGRFVDETTGNFDANAAMEAFIENPYMLRPEGMEAEVRQMAEQREREEEEMRQDLELQEKERDKRLVSLRKHLAKGRKMRQALIEKEPEELENIPLMDDIMYLQDAVQDKRQYVTQEEIDQYATDEVRAAVMAAETIVLKWLDTKGDVIEDKYFYEFQMMLEHATPMGIVEAALQIEEHHSDDVDPDPFGFDDPERGSFNPWEFGKGAAHWLAFSPPVNVTARWLQNWWRVQADRWDNAARLQIDSIEKHSGNREAADEMRQIAARTRHHRGKAQSIFLDAIDLTKRKDIRRKLGGTVELPGSKTLLFPNGVPTLVYVALMEGKLTPEMREQVGLTEFEAQRIYHALNATALYLRDTFVELGYPIMAPNEEGQWVWQEPHQMDQAVMPRIFNREVRDEILGDRDKRFALWQQWTDANPDMRIGRKLDPVTGKMSPGRPPQPSDFERMYREGAERLEGPDPERRAALEIARWIKNMPALDPAGRQLLEPDVITAFNRLMDNQSARLAVLEIIGGDYPTFVRKQFGLTKPGPTKWLKQFNKELLETKGKGEQELEDVKQWARDTMERLQGRDPEHVTAAMRRRQENSAVRRSLIVFMAGLHDIGAMGSETLHVGGLRRAARLAFRYYLGRERQAAIAYAHETGALAHEIGHIDLGERRGPVAKMAEAISAPSNWLEREKTIYFAWMAKREFLDQWAQGKRMPGDVEMITDLLNLNEAQAEALVSGQAPEALQHQFVVQLTQYLTARGRMAERTRLSASTTARLQIPFTGWATGRMAGVGKEANAYKDLFRGKTSWARRARLVYRLFRRFAGISMAGQVGLFLYYVVADALRNLTDPSEWDAGFWRFLRDWQQVPEQMFLRGTVGQLVGGPFMVIGNAAFEERSDIAELLLKLHEGLDVTSGVFRAVGSAFRQGTPRDAAEAMSRVGGAAIDIVQNTGYLPRFVVPAIVNTVARLGVDTDRWMAEERIIRQFMQNAGIKTTYGTPTRQPEFYQAMADVHAEMRRHTGELDELWPKIQEDLNAALELQTGQTAAAKIRMFRLLGRLNREQRHQFMVYRDDSDAYAQILLHDDMVQQLAEMVGRMEGSYPMDWATDLDMARQQAAAGASDAWATVVNRAVDQVSRRLEKGAPIGFEIDDLADAMALYPETLLRDRTITDQYKLQIRDLGNRSKPELSRFLSGLMLQRAQRRYKSRVTREATEEAVEEALGR